MRMMRSMSRPDAFARHLACLCFALFVSLRSIQAQQADTLAFRVVSYNVENLFDTRHDSLKDDREFLPQSTRHWNYAKYRKKLNALARTLTAIGGWTPPALVALCEVENDSVLRDLTRYSLLREADYRYIVTRSPDERGIDVALLYQRHLFKPLSHRSIRITPTGRKLRPTRDILHVCGLLLNGDTLDVLIAHFPSRRGGAKASEPYRLHVAQVLRQTCDSLIRQRRLPQLLLMGDFNAPPASKAVRDVLRALPPSADETPAPDRLYHLLARRAKEQQAYGSYKYQGHWELIDHLIVSGHLLCPDNRLHTGEAQAEVFAAPFLLEPDKKYGGMQPFRTYIGPRYHGGTSDHLPVVAEFELIY